MSDNKQKLELTWIGKNNPEFDISNIEPRILEENPELSNCTNDPNTENMIIHGDNLLALKALLPEYEGKIKCIYIDPPYNTGNAFEHYDDNVEHSLWLSLMKPRLELLRLLLADDGLIFVQVDDNEQAYLKILMDEIFGRDGFIANVAVKSSTPSGIKTSHKYKKIIKQKDTIIVYKKENCSLNPQYVRADGWDSHYSFFFNPNKEMKLFSLKDLLNDLGFEKNEIYNINNNKFRKFYLENAEFIVRKTSHKNEEIRKICLQSPGEIFFQNGSYYVDKDMIQPLSKSINKVLVNGSTYSEDISYLACDFWSDIDFQNTQNEGGVSFPNGKKPEALIMRVIQLSTNPGDIVLDSFLGSGSTCAVAHKLGRKYIGIEMGEQAFSHCKKRLDFVISGEDSSGISKSFGWKGGGAYKFYELAPSFITVDEYGNQVIDSYFNDTKLIRAMCKLLNFEFKPSQSEYWKHGIGQGNNYIYVTTQILSVGNVQQIKSYLKPNESLTICAKKFEPGCEGIDSKIIVKKIPQAILNSCQFGKKEYLLPIKEEIIDDTEDTELD